MTPKELEIVRTYLKCFSNAEETARALHYSPSTIRYHLQKVFMKTGLSPYKRDELVKLSKMEPIDNKTLKLGEMVIVKELASCNMNVTKAGFNLGYHYSTITYHLDRIEARTGLNPRNFYDLIELLKCETMEG